MRSYSQTGFSLVELIVVTAVMGVIMAIAIPMTAGMSDGMKLDAATRDVEREFQAARLRAVTSNRSFRVRLNCPAAGQLRMVEVMGTLAVDTAANRCSEATYPFPSPKDTNLGTPDFDGPIRHLNTRIQLSPAAPTLTLQFLSDGRVATVSSSGVVTAINGSVDVAVRLDTKTKVINVNSLGKVQIQ